MRTLIPDSLIPSKAKPKSKVASKSQPSLVEQIERAWKDKPAFLAGALVGGLVPVLTFQTAHHDVWNNAYQVQGVSPLWILVIGGLAFSAKSVFETTKQAFNDTTKAIGFTLIVEGMLTFSPTLWVAYIALFTLIAINAIATGSKLSRYK